MIPTFNTWEERCEVLGKYIVENQATVRKTASQFGISKSTVHKDITEQLQHHNPMLYADVKSLLAINKAQRHIRGGEATKLKYLHKTQEEANDSK